jgi:hypothetical protein
VLALALAFAPAAVEAAPAGDDGPKSKSARKLIVEGQRAAEAGEFDAAVEKYRASFEIEANAVTLWGWAQATRQATGCHDAVPLYQRFTRMVEEGTPAFDVAREALVECATEMADDDEAEPPAGALVEERPEDVADRPPPEVDPPRDQPPARDKQRPWHRDPLGGALVGVGLATTAAGAGVLIAAEVQNSQRPPTYGMFAQQNDRITTMRIAGGVVLGVGAALLIGGVVRWAVLGAKQKRLGAVRPSGPLGLAGRF